MADFMARVEVTAPQDRVYLLIDLMGPSTRVAVVARHLRSL